MAGNVAMRAMYATLGCSGNVAEALTADEGLDTCEELAELNESDGRQLCKTIRNTGGGQQGQQGHPVSNRAARYLTQTAMHCRMIVRIDRPLEPATIHPLGGMLATSQSQLELEDKHAPE